MNPILNSQTLVLGGGCFWCTEAVYKAVRGVTDVESGYSNGQAARPSYEDVCTGATGCNEVVKLVYDPAQVSTRELLEIFFVIHDPTTLNRQGNDRGTQYRSAIFPADAEQRTVAAAYIAQLSDAKVFASPIVTTIEPWSPFYPAEGYHQDYAARNPHQPYVAAVALPKVEKLRRYFPGHLRD